MPCWKTHSEIVILVGCFRLIENIKISVGILVPTVHTLLSPTQLTHVFLKKEIQIKNQITITAREVSVHRH